MTPTSGIHHITAITANPQKNLDFYEGFLGQRLVKRTVNFDDPSSYHFYFGDAYGRPGTLMTFFYWPHLPTGIRGTGEVGSIAYSIRPTAVDFWMQRARSSGIHVTDTHNAFGERVLMVQDPDGIRIELVVDEAARDLDWWQEGGVPKEFALNGFRSAQLTIVSVEEMRPVIEALGYTERARAEDYVRFAAPGDLAVFLDLYEAPDLQQSRQGSGSVHHIAFRAATDETELLMRENVGNLGVRPTPVIDRTYFHSVYFMTPGRILFEIATDAPGFTIDETRESLGERLVLPPHYEPHRAEIEPTLVPITLPRHAQH